MTETVALYMRLSSEDANEGEFQYREPEGSAASFPERPQGV